MAENPYAKYATPASEAPAENPYAKYAPAPEPKGTAVTRGASLVLGAPVDAVNSVLKAVGFPASPKPFLGSEQINDLMSSGNERYGPVAAVANGISFGTLPNAQAAVDAAANSAMNVVGAGDGSPFSERYDKTLVAQQDARRAYRDAHPLANAALEVVGGLASGGALAKGGATLVGRMPNEGLSNIIPRMFAGSVEGGAYGAASGFGGGEGSFENRAKGAGENLLLGAAVGTAAPPIVDAVKAGGRVAGNVVRGFYNANPQGHADELLVRALMRDKRTPEALAAEVRAATGQGQKEFVAADAGGKSAQRTLKLAARTPGEFSDTAAEFTANRQAGQSNRLGSYVDDLTGQKADDAFKTEQDILAQRKAAAEPAYDAAYKAPAPVDPFYTQESLGRQSVQDALPGAQRLAAEKQVPLSDLFTEVPNPNAQPVSRQVPSKVLGPDGNPVMTTVEEVKDPTLRVPTVRGWDYIKRSLDADVNKLYANSAVEAPAVKETRNMLRERLATDVPEYGQALQQYSDDSALLDALGIGRDVANSSGLALDGGEAAFKKLTPEQQKLARLGYARELKGKITSGDTEGRDVSRPFTGTDAKRKASVMAVSPEAETVFGSRLGRERDMLRTNRAIAGGSDTAGNILDQNDAVNGGVLTALLSGRPMVALGRGAEGLSRRAAGMNEDVAKRVGDILLSNDPNKIQGLADLFYRTQQSATAPSIGPTIINAGVNAPRQKNGQPKKELP